MRNVEMEQAAINRLVQWAEKHRNKRRMMDTITKATRGKIYFIVSFIILLPVLLSISCTAPCFLACGQAHPTDTPPGVSTDQNIEIFYGTGDATTTYIIAHGTPDVLSTCHDTNSYALVKVYTKQQVQKYLEFNYQLGPGEYNFMAEIHPALLNPWQNKQCVYAQNQSEYGWLQINGVLNTTTGEMTQHFTNDAGCLNAAKFEWNGTVTDPTYIFMAYDCVNGNTTYHYTFNMEMQNLPRSSAATP